ncbi:MAG: entericidin A/B family lipoprotein [Verrucomicrobiales bacterium]
MKKNRLSLPLLILLSAAAALFLSSCNTFIGMGRDFQRLGQGFENTGYGRKF